jgi:cyanate permease
MTYIVLAIMAGIIMDRWGIKKSIFAGALIIGLSATLRAFSTGFFTLLIFVALFGAGGPMISIGCPKTIALWFKGKERGTAVGIYTTGPWIGGMICLAATNGVVMPLVGNSWRLTFICYGTLAFGLALLWLFLAKDVNPETESERFNPISVLTDLMKVPNVRIILICGLLSFGIGHGYFSWLPNILESKGFSPTHAGIGAAIPFIASIPAMLTIPRSVPAHVRGKTIALLSVVGVLSILWVVATSLPPIIGLLLFGATGTCLLPLLVLTLMDTPEVASKYLGAATGVFFCVAEIGGFFGPFVVGYLVDITGGFLTGAFFLVALGLVILALMLPLKIPKAAGLDKT